LIDNVCRQSCLDYLNYNQTIENYMYCYPRQSILLSNIATLSLPFYSFDVSQTDYNVLIIEFYRYYLGDDTIGTDNYTNVLTITTSDNYANDIPSTIPPYKIEFKNDESVIL